MHMEEKMEEREAQWRGRETHLLLASSDGRTLPRKIFCAPGEETDEHLHSQQAHGCEEQAFPYA